MRFLFYLLVLFMCQSCIGEGSEKIKESLKGVKECIALEEIVYQRTEGLLILEKLSGSAFGKKPEELYYKILLYYQQSQPQLVGMCKDKELNLSMTAYEKINQSVEMLVKDTTSFDNELFEAFLHNLKRQRSLYFHVLEDSDLQHMHSYMLECYLQIVCFIEDIEHFRILAHQGYF